MSEHAPYLEPPLRVAEIEGGVVAWREQGAGEGSPLVLVHGIGSNARAWAGQFAGLSSGRRVVAWNAPGYAGSTPLTVDWPEGADYARALDQWLEKLSIRHCVLVGQSLGAIMAAAYAKLRPERVDHLVLANPASGYGLLKGELNPQITARLTDLETLGPVALANKRYGRLLTDQASEAARDIVRQAMAEIEPACYRAACRLLACSDLAAMVMGLAPPITVILGQEDAVTPPDGCRKIARAAAADLIELPGLGHAAATEGPAAFNRAIMRVLDSHERTDR